MIQKITVIGAGTMGNGIAHSFAQFGFPVNLVDISESALRKGISTIEKNVCRQVEKGTITVENKVHILKRISIFTSLELGTKDADLVIEAATEDQNIKLSIFKQLDSLCQPNCILASNTSSISITKIASVTNRPEKVIGMHFMNPVPIMKLVEVITGFSTSSEVKENIISLSKKLEKTPVVANDVPGFVANRILMPMINEAIITLNEGICDVKGIDEIMKLGMAHPMGPLQLADFIGLDVCLSILKVLYEGLGNPKYAPSPLLVNMVQAGQLGRKSGSGFYDWKTNTKDLKVADKFIEQSL